MLPSSLLAIPPPPKPISATRAEIFLLFPLKRPTRLQTRPHLMAVPPSSTVGPEVSAEYSGNRLIIFTAIFIPVQIFCVALRYFVRYSIKGPWGLDDILGLTSLLLQLCMAGLSIGEKGTHLFLIWASILLMIHTCRICQNRSWLPHPLFRSRSSRENNSVGQIHNSNLDALLRRH